MVSYRVCRLHVARDLKVQFGQRRQHELLLQSCISTAERVQAALPALARRGFVHRVDSCLEHLEPQAPLRTCTVRDVDSLVKLAGWQEKACTVHREAWFFLSGSGATFASTAPGAARSVTAKLRRLKNA